MNLNQNKNLERTHNTLHEDVGEVNRPLRD